MIGQPRKIAIGHSDQLVLGPQALDLGPVIVSAAERQLVARQRFDDIEQMFGAERYAPFFLDVRGQLGADADRQVGGCNQDGLLAVGAKKNVCDDGKRAFAISDPLRGIQTLEELGFLDLEFHALTFRTSTARSIWDHPYGSRSSE